MFSSGNCSRWIIVDKTELIGPMGELYYWPYHKTMLRSWDKTNSSVALWWRRWRTWEDPWVSRFDHSGGDEDVVLYGANSHGGHIDIVKNYGGADVFIRKSKATDLLVMALV